MTRHETAQERIDRIRNTPEWKAREAAIARLTPGECEAHIAQIERQIAQLATYRFNPVDCDGIADEPD